MINKNKEEIEKIKDLIKSFKEGNIDTYALRKELKATIKTSIQWCEDEIELIENVIDGIILDDNIELDINEIHLKLKRNLKNKLSQLQIHLTWLKEKLKEKENE
jgi:hypothetical protein